jgi:hypothetical protein
LHATLITSSAVMPAADRGGVQDSQCEEPWSNKCGFIKDSKGGFIKDSMLNVLLQNKLDETFKPYRDLLAAGNYRSVTLEASSACSSSSGPPLQGHQQEGQCLQPPLLPCLQQLEGIFEDASRPQGLCCSSRSCTDPSTATIAIEPVMRDWKTPT